MPIVTTLHTILREPDPDQRRVLQEVAGLSDRLVVMSARGAKFLHEIYGVPNEKIDFIPHGIPDVPFVDPSFHKDLFGVEGKTVLLSFGLLSANKGIENVISALPDILAKHPNVVYIILGATHPHVIQHDGENYRLGLQWLAQERGALVPFGDPAALADKVIDLLDNESNRHAMRKRAYMFGRDMIWPQVAHSYRKTFERARSERRHYCPIDFAVKPLDKRPGELPPLKLDHLHNMTDATGMLQHALFTVPNYSEGYTTDDNARALMVGALLEELGHSEAKDLSNRYLAFICY